MRHALRSRTSGQQAHTPVPRAGCWRTDASRRRAQARTERRGDG